MKRFLTSYQKDGSLDWLTSLIEIQKYDPRGKSDLERIMSSSPELLKTSWEIDALSLFTHEYTHYLDLTSTTWGLEFLLRKNGVLKSLGDEDALKRTSSVFMLNLAEMDMHASLLNVVDGDAKLSQCEISHSLEYSERYGCFIFIHFERDGARVLSTPLSMLSLLEANAYSSEVICKIRFWESKGDMDQLLLLEKEVYDYLNSPDLSEYSLLLTICCLHFEYLSLKECLVLYQFLASTALNMNGMNLSIISSFIETTFANKRIGSAICMDLRRGMSRQVLLFTLILLLYQSVNESQDREGEIMILKRNPREALKRSYAYASIHIYEELEQGPLSEFSIHLKTIKETREFQERDFIHPGSEFNRRRLLGYDWARHTLSDFLLPDIFLIDGTVIEAPQRIGINIQSYFDAHFELTGQIETLYKRLDISKFHQNPGASL
jgi:hypothetical protein